MTKNKASPDQMNTLQLEGNKLLYHLDRLNDWKKGEKVAPLYVAFSPSSLCNHKCTFCVYHYKEFKPIFFPYKRYVTLVDEFVSIGVRSLFFAGDGEPLLNRDCIKMISYTRNQGIDIAMNTNGRLLREGDEITLARDLDWIRFSVNAGNAKDYSTIHKTSEDDFEIVLSNIEKVVNERNKTNSDIVIGVQCVLLNENKDSIESLALRVKEIGVDYLAVKPFLKHPDTSWECELEEKEKILSVLTKLHRLNDDFFKFHLREGNFSPKNERSYERCLSGRLMIEIDAKGDIYSCGPYIGHEEHRYGNVLEDSFMKVWGSDECQEKISKIQSCLDVSKCMPNCRPNSVNESLWRIKNPPKHKNFI